MYSHWCICLNPRALRSRLLYSQDFFVFLKLQTLYNLRNFLVHEDEQAEIPRSDLWKVPTHCEEWGRRSKKHLRSWKQGWADSQLWVCNSAYIIHNVTEAWGRGRGRKNRKNRDSRYSVAGAEDGKWPSPLRPSGHPIQLICAFEDEKPVSCDKLNNRESIFLSTGNQLSQTYLVTFWGRACVIFGLQRFWMCQVCLAAWLQWKGNGSALHYGSWQRTLTSLCSKLVRENCGLNRQVPGHSQRVMGKLAQFMLYTQLC